MLATDFQTTLDVLDESSVHRRLTVKPAMCGHNSLFVGQIGDWTWETVSALCGTDVFTAHNGKGQPTYLAFYYFHVKGSPKMHLRRFTFGDRISVSSRLFDFGSESILTLHRIGMAEDEDVVPRRLDPVEFYEHPRDQFLYVENFNRWITRGANGGNRGLLRSSPVGFRHEHLPALPKAYSPRRAGQRARRDHSFLDPSPDGFDPLVEEFTVDYPLDITRDINGVGLVYFASYFSLIDWALLRLWRRLGRSDRSFLDLVVLDQQLCYLGNAQLDSVLQIRMTAWQSSRDPAHQLVSVVVQERASRDVLAVCGLDLRSEEIP